MNFPDLLLADLHRGSVSAVFLSQTLPACTQALAFFFPFPTLSLPLASLTFSICQASEEKGSLLYGYRPMLTLGFV